MSDGPELKIHTHSSSSISSSLMMMKDDKMMIQQQNHPTPVTTINSIDYFYNSSSNTNDELILIWTETSGDSFSSGHLNVDQKQISNKRVHGIPSHHAPISNFVVDPRYKPPVIFSSHDSSGLIRVYSLNVDDDMDSETGCIWINETIKPGQVVIDFNREDELSVVYWIQNGTCIFKSQYPNYQQKVICVNQIITQIRPINSFTITGSYSYLLFSSGEIYRHNLRTGGIQNLIPESFYDGHPDFKYGHEDYFKSMSSIVNEDESSIQLFISNSNHGDLFQVNVSCTTESSCHVTNSRLVLIERKIYDAKVVTLNKVTGHKPFPFKMTTNFSLCQETVTPDGDIRPYTFLTYPEPIDSDEWNKWTGLSSFMFASTAMLCLMGLIFVTLLISSVIWFRRYKNRSSHMRYRRNISQTTIENGDGSLSTSGVKTKTFRGNSGSCVTVNPDRTVSIEDLGGFANHAFFEKSCDVCEYKDECSERGICLSTYRLLT